MFMVFCNLMEKNTMKVDENAVNKFINKTTAALYETCFCKINANKKVHRHLHINKIFLSPTEIE